MIQRAGALSYFVAAWPTVERMLASGEAHLVASMGEATGPVPFTSYMTTPEFLRDEPGTVLRFTRALYRTRSFWFDQLYASGTRSARKRRLRRCVRRSSASAR